MSVPDSGKAGPDRTGNRLTRRRLIEVAGAGVAVLSAQALLSCGPQAPAAAPATAPAAAPTAAPAAPAAPTKAPAAAAPAAKEQVTLELIEGSYEPEIKRQNLDRFQTHFGLKVNAQFLGGAISAEKIIAGQMAGVAPDVHTASDRFAQWVEGGYLEPIDGRPGVAELAADTFPFVQEMMTYKGKQYGLAYYGDFEIFIFNEKMLKDAGFGEPPKTWEEVKTQALAIKKAGIVEYPLILDAGKPPSWWNWPSYVYASGGRLFDEETEPLFPDKDPTALEVTQWLVDAIHTWKILDIKSLELDLEASRDVFASGQAALTAITKYDLERVNNPKYSKVAGLAKQTLMPTFSGPCKGTFGWAWPYVMSSQSKHKDEAFKLLYYIGGKDWEGNHYVAKRWYLEKALGFAYKSLWNDPEIVKSTEKWGDPKLLAQQGALAKQWEHIKTPWAGKFNDYHREVMQNILLKKATPKEGLTLIAKKARDLKAEWKK